LGLVEIVIARSEGLQAEATRQSQGGVGQRPWRICHLYILTTPTASNKPIVEIDKASVAGILLHATI
jgi:hypothetical protein